MHRGACISFTLRQCSLAHTVHRQGRPRKVFSEAASRAARRRPRTACPPSAIHCFSACAASKRKKEKGERKSARKRARVREMQKKRRKESERASDRVRQKVKEIRSKRIEGWFRKCVHENNSTSCIGSSLNFDINTTSVPRNSSCGPNTETIFLK